MNSPCSWVCWLRSGAGNGGQTTAGCPGSRPPSRSPVRSSTGSVLVLRQDPGDCSGQTGLARPRWPGVARLRLGLRSHLALTPDVQGVP